MAGSGQEKTEQATPRKLRKAREEGQVAVSRDLTSVGVLLAGLFVLDRMGGQMARTLAEIQRACVLLAAQDEHNPAFVLDVLSETTTQAGLSCLPILITVTIAAAVFPLIQVSPLLALKALMPKIERLNPIEGLKKKILSARMFVELAKNLFKATVALVICAHVIHIHVRAISLLPGQPPQAAIALSGQILYTCVVRVLSAFFALGVVDLLYQRWQYGRDQRMSKEDVKREYKDDEGDPQLNAQRKQMHRDIAMNDMFGNVGQRGDVAIRNPTHITCVLSYDPRTDAAPVLVAKGTDWLALELARIAEEEGIPVVRNVPLARSLRTLDLESTIPRELYDAVAEVLHWAEDAAERRGRRVRWRRDGAAL